MKIIFLSKHMFWIVKRNISVRHFFQSPRTYCFDRIYRNDNHFWAIAYITCSKTCLIRPLKTNILMTSSSFMKVESMLPLEHSAILLTCIKG